MGKTLFNWAKHGMVVPFQLKHLQLCQIFYIHFAPPPQLQDQMNLLRPKMMNEQGKGFLILFPCRGRFTVLIFLQWLH